LRFRTRDEIERSLADAGFIVEDVRDAPDRPGCEFVFVAQRSSRAERIWARRFSNPRMCAPRWAVENLRAQMESAVRGSAC
jgi:hypothetical protein